MYKCLYISTILIMIKVDEQQLTLIQKKHIYKPNINLANPACLLTYKGRRATLKFVTSQLQFHITISIITI